MTESLNIKTWNNIKDEIINNAQEKNVLLGNGFSLCWDFESFRQDNLKEEIEILNEIEEPNTEKCIKLLKSSINEQNIYRKTLLNIIDTKITSDFIKVLFKRLPQRINKNKSTPFVKFLSIFNNYFTLNYDSLLYFLLNKFKTPNQISSVLENEQEIENIRTIIAPIVKEYTKRKLYTKNLNNEYEIIGAISDEKMDFIRKQIVSELKKQDNAQISELFNGRGLKRGYKEILNNMISETQEGEIELEMKVLKFSDGFKQSIDELLWHIEEDCNLFHLHGAYHIIKFKNTQNIKKIASTTKNAMLENIEEYLNRGNVPVVILDGSSQDKINKIRENDYLKYCYNSLGKTNDIIVTLGVSFANNDQHIVNAIINNPNLNKIYIGLWNDDKLSQNYEELKIKFNSVIEKVTFYTYNDTFTELENDEENSANDSTNE